MTLTQKSDPGPEMRPWNMRLLKCDPKMWPWNLTFKSDSEIWPWNVIRKSNLEIWPWNLTLKSEPEIWIWNVTLKCGPKIRPRNLSLRREFQATKVHSWHLGQTSYKSQMGHLLLKSKTKKKQVVKLK